jgi:hypothetical protein
LATRVAIRLGRMLDQAANALGELADGDRQVTGARAVHGGGGLLLVQLGLGARQLLLGGGDARIGIDRDWSRWRDRGGTSRERERDREAGNT